VTRVPNRCWVKQADGGDAWHREDRVVAKADANRVGHGETYCGLKLRGDRIRKRDLPKMSEGGLFCVKCQHGNYDEYRFAGRRYT
jgi:hypothetical protein